LRLAIIRKHSTLTCERSAGSISIFAITPLLSL
jgi:hypothetical protein